LVLAAETPVSERTREDPDLIRMNRALTFFLMFLILIAHSRAATTQPVSFLDAANEVTTHIQKTYYHPDTGLYDHSTTKREPEAMWGNGVMFSALVGAARHDPQTYKPILSKFFDAMDAYWDAKAKIPGYEPWPTRGNGNDKYYDDNEWMVITFLEAYDLTKDKKYLNRADETLKFALSGWDEQMGGGIWWHEQHKSDSKNTCSNAPADRRRRGKLLRDRRPVAGNSQGQPQRAARRRHAE
jgi:hypothetical protein